MSTTTTQKNTNFQSTPLQDVKAITDMPGVGDKSAEKLEEANIKTPVQLMGQFMVVFLARLILRPPVRPRSLFLITCIPKPCTALRCLTARPSLQVLNCDEGKMIDWLKAVCELRVQVHIGLEALPCRVSASFFYF